MPVLTDSPVDAPPHHDPIPAVPRATADASWWRKAWAAPLWAHVVALAVVLVALLPLLGIGSSFSADEGAAITQARHLARGEGWIVDHPLPQIDPSGRAYPLELSGRGTKGSAPFNKHPLNALALAAADRLGGVTAMVLLSIVGTVVAAALSAVLAGYLRPTLARPSLWVAGLATPLLFNGYVVIAHTLGAACAAGSVVFALRLLEGRGGRVSAIAGVTGCVALGALVRSEATLWGIGLCVVLGVVALSRRRPCVLGAAGAAFVAVAAVRVGEQHWISGILGSPPSPIGGGEPTVGASFLAGHLQSIQLTWLAPGYGRSPGGTLALLVMLGAVIAGAAAVRRMSDERPLIIALAATAAAAALAAVVIAPTNLVPGLLVTSPILAAGLVSLRRSTLTTVGSRVALGTYAFFAAAVLLTQPAGGGFVEWGGRYFAIGLPVLVPVVVLALADAGRRLDPVTRRSVVAGFVVCSLALAVMGLATLTSVHRRMGRLTATADRVGRELTPAGKPLMVSTVSNVPRLAWATYDRQNWLIATPGELGDLVGRLRVSGVSDFTLVTRDLSHDVATLGPGFEVVPSGGPPIGAKWQVVKVHLRP